jgi:hypothetical protein
VDDLVPDVDRRAVVLERKLDGLDSAFHAGAEPARRSKEDALDHEADGSCVRFRYRPTRLFGDAGTRSGRWI